LVTNQGGFLPTPSCAQNNCYFGDSTLIGVGVYWCSYTYSSQIIDISAMHSCIQNNCCNGDRLAYLRLLAQELTVILVTLA
jgi:hypothetical protein